MRLPKNLPAGALLSLRDEIDHALAGMVRVLEQQLVKIKGTGTGNPSAKRAPTKRKASSKLAGRKVAPKYRNPENKSETWAGRGMKPKWLVTALKGGKKLEHFAVKK
jgi:DNA-binding protein H-NS